jgi:hypothetical protein
MRPSSHASHLRIVEPPRRRPERQQHVQAVGDAIVQRGTPVVERGCEARNQLRVGVPADLESERPVAVPHTAGAIDDIGTIADCVPAKVGFCIAGYQALPRRPPSRRSKLSDSIRQAPVATRRILPHAPQQEVQASPRLARSRRWPAVEDAIRWLGILNLVAQASMSWPSRLSANSWSSGTARNKASHGFATSSRPT